MRIVAVSAILGWLAGILSQLVLDEIRRRRRQKEVCRGVIAELLDLRLRLATSAYQFERRFGSLDRSLVTWLISILEKHKDKPEVYECLEDIKKVAILSNQEFNDYVERQKAKPLEGLSIRKYRVPYLDSNIGELGAFKEHSRVVILDVRSQLEMFNELVDEARLYYKMTFELHDSDVNHATACGLVQNCYKDLGQRAKLITDRIETILANI